MRVTHGACGKTWKQKGNKSGHCSNERWSVRRLTVGNSDTLFAPSTDTHLLERSPDVSRITPHDLSHLVGAEARDVQGSRILVPREVTVFETVLFGSQRDKVFGTVISPVPIDVVNMLFRRDEATEHTVLVGFDVSVRSDLPAEADVTVTGGVPLRLMIGDSLPRKKVARSSAVTALSARGAKAALGGTSDLDLAGLASLVHGSIVQVGTLCHDTYYGITAFDAHQTLSPSTNDIVCERKGEWWADEDGQWHKGRRLTEAETQKIWGRS